MLAGKPLLVWTLEACVGAKKINEVILSTDSMEYWGLAKEYISPDKLILDYRSPVEAGDKVKIFDYLKNERSKIFGGRDGSFVLALPTVPLRKSIHIDEAIARYEEKKQAVFSATEYNFPVSFAFNVSNNGSWAPVFNDNPMITGNTRSQDQQKSYRPNGAIYVRSIKDLENENLQTLYYEAVPYLMDQKYSVDVDGEIDFHIAAALMHDKLQ